MLNELWSQAAAFGGAPLYLVVMLMFLLERHSLGWLLLQGFVIVYVLGYGLRLFYFKRRKGYKEPKTLFEKLDSNSFPSGHAMRGTVLVGLLITVFDHYLQISLLLVAWLLMLSTRLELERHDIWDVVGGVFLGVLVVMGLLA